MQRGIRRFGSVEPPPSNFYFLYNNKPLGDETMKSRWAAIAIAAACLQFPAQAADSDDLPIRKAGRWELKTVMDEGLGPREQTMTMCVDAEMEQKTSAASKGEHKESCSKYEIKKADGKIVIDAVCRMNERNVESKTEMSGDFQKSFAVRIESTTSGMNGSQSVSVKRTITQDGTFMGESCGDLKAGEAMGPSGERVMVQ